MSSESADFQKADARDKPRALGRAGLVSLGALRDYGILLGLVALFIYLSLASDVFLTTNNMRNLVDQAVAVGLIACAGTLVIIAGGFDLSAGAIFAVAALVGAEVANSSGSELGILAGLGVGVLLGLANGILCTVGRINHFVGTLGTSIVFAGMASAIGGGSLILIAPQSFGNLASTEVLGLKSSTLIFVVFTGFCAFILGRTVFGRQIFATGGNLVASRLSGVPINRTLMATYVLSGFAAALAGLIVASRTLSVNSNTGAGIIFDALAAILIGGNSVLGGEGAIWRTVVGVFILATIANGFNLLGIDPLYQQMVTGAIILLAVGADAWARRR